jgi:membrane fusion protein (multidrug efflux system)
MALALATTPLFWLACSDPHVAADAPRRLGPRAVEVETALARRGTALPRLVAPGSIVARRTSQISAEVTGRIDQVFVDVGDRIEVGDPLFEIDRSTYEAAVREAEATLELARAERRQVESDLERAKGLRREEVLAEQQLERIETQLAVARARASRAQAALVIARENLAKTRVLAPYAGTVAQRLADEGTTARTMPQTIVLELQETGELEGQAALPEAVHARVRVGDRVALTVDGLHAPLETRVEAIAETIDPATRTFLVRMRVANPDHRIKAGVFARVEIFCQAGEALLIPRSAVRREAGRASVLAVREGETVEVPVRLGVASEEAVEVLSGLDAGERVVVGDAARELAPGTPVTPRPIQESSPT